MRRRLERVRAAERLGQDLEELAANAKASNQNVLANADLVLTAAYLVPREDFGSFCDALDAFGRSRAPLTFVRTGPWPPYSFAVVDGPPS